MKKIKPRYLKVIRLFLATLFFSAGIAHYLYHEVFTEVIPEMLPFRTLINSLVGTLEIALAILFFSKYKHVAYLTSFF